MTIGTVPSALDISHVGQSGVAAQRLHTFLDSLTSTLGTVTSPFSYKGDVSSAATFPALATIQTGDFYHMTADATDTGVAGKTSTGQSFLAGDEIVWNGTNWTLIGQALTAPFQFKGNIAAASDFPPPAATATTGVKDGYVYRCTAGVTDNDGTKTNTGQVFLLGDIILWRTSGWYIIQKAPSAATPSTVTIAASSAGTSGRPSNDDHTHQLTAAVAIDKGAISAPTGFPLIASVRQGDIYRISNATADTGGSSYTNTGITFLEGDVIMWTGSTWRTLGNKTTFQVTAVTPVVLPAGDSVNYVDTATLGSPSAVALPLVTAAMVGRTITIADGSGDCAAHNIVVTPNTTDRIDGVNAAITLNKNWLSWTIQAVAPGYWETVSRVVPVASASTPAAIGSATAGTSLVPSPDDHVHAHGNQLGGTLHADVIAGGASGFMTGAQATALAAISDDHVYAKASAVDIMTDESEKIAVLTGDGAKHFVPTHLIIQVATVTGTPATPGVINVGTTSDGTQIASGVALTGLILVGDTRVVPLTAQTQHLAGNATLYVNVETAEGTATVMTCDVWVKGYQV